MYQPMLYIHWKQVRLLLIPFLVAAFGLPLVVVQGLGSRPGAVPDLGPYEIIAQYQLFLPVFPVLAGGIGIVLALTAWQWDHQHGHVYALTLPVARWEYAMVKMAAGVVLGLIPAGALWLGAHVAAASITLPEGLHAYPNELALRFFIALLLAYALCFAMAAGTIKTTVWFVSGVISFFIVGDILNSALALFIPFFQDVSIVGVVGEWLVRAGGPLGVFTGNWTLIDV
jgi:hypothetical protein